MRWTAPCVISLALLLQARGAEIRFDFNSSLGGAVPTNFVPVLAGEGPPGEWRIVTDDVPSGMLPFAGQAPSTVRSAVLAQTSADPANERFPMLIHTGEKFRDFKFTARFKTVGGKAEQMAGFVFRYQNPTNYYVVRANALEKNVRFYKVIDGIRSDPIGPEMEVPTNEWQTLAVQCEGSRITIWLNNREVMPALGDSSLNEGLVGFRTKSDTAAYFADARVEYTPITPGAQTLLKYTLAKQPKLLGLRIYRSHTNSVPHVVASMDPAENGMAGTEAEAQAIREGAVSFGREKGAVVVTLPLQDRNGEFIAAVRVRLKTFLGETQNNAVTRARMVVREMQTQVTTEKGLD